MNIDVVRSHVAFFVPFLMFLFLGIMAILIIPFKFKLLPKNYPLPIKYLIYSFWIGGITSTLIFMIIGGIFTNYHLKAYEFNLLPHIVVPLPFICAIIGCFHGIKIQKLEKLKQEQNENRK